MFPSDAKLDVATVAKGGLHAFVKLAWEQVCPGIAYVDNWHIGLICRKLEAVSRGEIKRLLINIPPACTKSLLVSIMWPVWEWIERPRTSFLNASYDDGLIHGFGEKVAKLLKSAWFVERWGHRLHPTKPVATGEMYNVNGGLRFGTTIRGALTGHHGDIGVIDDPHNALDAESLTIANLIATANWHARSWKTRRKDPKSYREVVMMQRLHESDLSGVLLATWEAGSFEHLCLPMRYDPEHPYRHPEDPRTVKGELLCPDRWPDAIVSELERDPMLAAGQLQQLPSKPGGSIFKLGEWGIMFWAPKDHPLVGTYCTLELSAQTKISGIVLELPDDGVYRQSWDLTFKKTEGSDLVAGTTWNEHNGLHYLVDLVNQRQDYVDSKNAIRNAAACWPRVRDIYIEDKANGPAVEADLRDEIPMLEMVEPLGGKVVRAIAASPAFAYKLVVVPHPEIHLWVKPYLKQLVGFPRVTHDDMVDSTTQYLARVRSGLDLFMRAMNHVGHT